MTYPSQPARTPVFRTAAILLSALTAGTFIFVVYARSEVPIHAYDGIDGALTAGTMNVAEQWCQEGPWKLRFGMYWEPPSVEYPSPATRTPYISFPPGAIIPVYLVAKLSAQPPSIFLVTVVNLSIHFFVSLVLGWIVLGFAVRQGLSTLSALILACTAPLLYLTLPAPYFEHRMGYFSDQAVMLPFALLVLFELSRAARPRRWLSWAITVVLFWGTFTDWLFLPLAGCAYLARFVIGDMRGTWRGGVQKTALFWVPVLLALGLYAGQLYRLGAFSDLWERWAERSAPLHRGIRIGAEATPELSATSLFSFSLDNRFWNEFIPKAYGEAGKNILLGLAVFLLLLITALSIRSLRHRPPGRFQPLLHAFLLTCLPCFLYYHLLKAHCAHPFHFFTTLKFAVPLSLLPLALIPATLLGIAQARRKPGTDRCGLLITLAALGLLVGTLLFTLAQQDLRSSLFAPRTTRCDEIAHFIGENTSYEDIVFSRRYQLPHHFNGLSGKQMHLVRTLDDMAGIASRAAGPYVVNLYLERGEDYGQAPEWAALAAKAFDKRQQDARQLLKVHQEDFEPLAANAKAKP
jgi:hypothetical protein